MQNTIVPACENAAWAATKYQLVLPNANLDVLPAAARVIDNIYTPDPLFIDYVPADQAPIQPREQLLSTFEQDFHDVGCLVYPSPQESGGYQFAFLPSNLRYSPEDLTSLFPWASLVDFKRTGHALPYSLAYALPGGAPPSPAVAHELAFPSASLLGYSLQSAGLQAGGLFELTLFFRVNQPGAVEEWFRLALVDPTQPGNPTALDQADPCRGAYPAPLWLPGQVILAKTILAVPEAAAPGDYALQLGMFNLPDGPDTALPATGEPTLVTLHLPGP